MWHLRNELILLLIRFRHSIPTGSPVNEPSRRVEQKQSIGKRLSHTGFQFRHFAGCAAHGFPLTFKKPQQRMIQPVSNLLGQAGGRGERGEGRVYVWEQHDIGQLRKPGGQL